MDWQPMETAPESGWFWAYDKHRRFGAPAGVLTVARLNDKIPAVYEIYNSRLNIGAHSLGGWMPLAPRPPAALGAPAMKGDVT